MQLFVSTVDSRWRLHATNHLGWWSPDRRGQRRGQLLHRERARPRRGRWRVLRGTAKSVCRHRLRRREPVHLHHSAVWDRRKAASGKRALLRGNTHRVHERRDLVQRAMHLRNTWRRCRRRLTQPTCTNAIAASPGKLQTRMLRHVASAIVPCQQCGAPARAWTVCWCPT